MLSRNILRILFATRAVLRLSLDRVVIAPLLRLLGVEFGKGCRFSGMPIVKRHPDSRIIVERGVLVISRGDENPATIPHRTMLSTLGKGAIIRIGADAGISGASIAASIAVEIGERSQIGSGAMLWDTDFHPLDPDLRRAHRTAGAAQAPIRVGCDVFIGARAIVLKGVTIGDGAVVGAGAVVAADVPPGALVAGNPARVIRDVVRGGSRPLRPLET